MINESNFLKNAIGYLNGTVSGVTFYPVKQKTNPAFPCGVVTIKSNASQMGVTGELLANVTLNIMVYADEIYATPHASGVITICDSINEVLARKGFTRSNQTEPVYNPTYRKWLKDIQFKIKSNAF